MGALTTQNIGFAGTKPNFSLDTPTTSDTAEVGDGRSIFAVYKNTDASSKTVTIVMTSKTLTSGDAYPNKVYTLPATTGELWIPLIKDHADDTGRATITLSNVTGVTVAVVRR